MEPINTHLSYLLTPTPSGERLVISRVDPDGWTRTVAFVENVEQWERFVVALDDNNDEVAAVHAIDQVRNEPTAP